MDSLFLGIAIIAAALFVGMLFVGGT